MNETISFFLIQKLKTDCSIFKYKLNIYLYFNGHRSVILLILRLYIDIQYLQFLRF